MRELCMICRHPSRTSRFSTQSSTICQWCVQEIKRAVHSPEAVVKATRARLRSKIKRSSAVPLSDDELRKEMEVQLQALRRDWLSWQVPRDGAIRIFRAHHLGVIEYCQEQTPRLTGVVARELGASIRKRDQWVCMICKTVPRGSELHVHHIIPLAAFGTNHRANLVTLCLTCHRHQHPDIFIDRIRDIADELPIEA
jgi:HNH endonuclease